MSVSRIIFSILLSISSYGYAESLYQEGVYKPLAADSKAYRIGDVVTVMIVENSIASTNADTNTRRKNTMGVGLKADIGDNRHPNLGANLAIGGDFDGGGRTQRAGKFVAQITVNVKEILPNGDLRVAGEQSLTINNELQKINLEGRVRPQDITDANVVVSTRLADSKITYAGDGDLADRQKTSWWRTFADWLGF